MEEGKGRHEKINGATGMKNKVDGGHRKRSSRLDCRSTVPHYHAPSPP